MREYVKDEWLNYKPVAWKRARRKGNCYFDSQLPDKRAYVFLSSPWRRKIGLIQCPVRVDLEFHFKAPPSWSRAKRDSSVGRAHPSKPDIDNLVKFFLDAFNGILWADDALVAEVCAKKVYSDVNGIGVSIYGIES